MIIIPSWSKRILLCLVFSIFASFPVSNIHAASKQSKEKWYEVEIIVFAQDVAKNYESEIWLEKPGSPNIYNNVEHFTDTEILLNDDADNLTNYLIQPTFNTENENTLGDYARKINKSQKYKLLVHRSWRQTLKTKKIYLTDRPNTDPVDENSVYEDLNNETSEDLPELVSPEDMLLQALLVEEKSFSQPLSQLPFFISEMDRIEPFDDVRGMPVSVETPLSFEGPPQHLVYGNFQLSRGRYLHMNIDFLYRGEPYTPDLKELSVDEEFPMDKDNKFAPMDKMRSTSLSKMELLELLSGFIIKEKPPHVGFRIEDSKRVRLNKIYYSDHPMFGVIVRVIRYIPPPVQEVSEES